MGFSEGTSARLWRDKSGTPTISRAYYKARRDAFSQAIGLTQRYAPLAVNTLAQVMADQAAPASSCTCSRAAALLATLCLVDSNRRCHRFTPFKRSTSIRMPIFAAWVR